MFLLKKIISLLTAEQKRQTFFLLILIFVGMLFEMLGVGLIFPILTLMTDANPLDKYPIFQPVAEFLGSPSQSQLVAWSMITLTVFYFIKVLFLIYLAWRKVLFSTSTRVYFSQKLFLGYLHQPYSFHLQRNSSDLVRNVISDVKSWNKGLLSIMDLVTDGFILIGIFSLLIWAEPLGAISITIFLAVTAILLHRVTRSRITRWGKESRHHGAKGMQHLLQGLGGVKELKLLGREKEFGSQYNIHNFAYAKIDRKQRVVSSLPRLWFELLVIIGLTGLVLSMLYQGKSPSELVPILGLFATAAFRMMPSMVRIITALQNLQFCSHAVDKLHDDFSMLVAEKERGLESNETVSALSSWKCLEVKNLSYKYPESSNLVLNKVNFSINRNESVGFIGGSGAGKSTLIDIILGLLPPSEGDVFLDEKNINTFLRAWQAQIGYVPQSIYLTDDTVRRNIAFGVENKDIDDLAVQKAVKSARLEDFINGLEEGLNTVVGEQGVRISGGQRQRIGIARALYHNPSVLVLDEATSALDMETEKYVMRSVNALHGEKTIITIAHRMSTVANCDRLYRLEQGKIVQEGTFDEVVNGYASS